MSDSRWYISPFNQELPGSDGPVIFHDCSLRETEQQPEVVLSFESKIRLTRALLDAGVEQIEAGVPGQDDRQLEHVVGLVKEFPEAKFTAVAAARRPAVELAAKCGVWGVLCSIGTDPLQLQHKSKSSAAEALDNAAEAVAFARDEGLYVILSMAYATRAALDFLGEITAAAGRLGADRVRVVDSPGAATPSGIAFLVSAVRAMTSLPIEIHCHDDFGLATANTLSGVAAGATVASCSLGGFGPRAGNAALEEVALGLEVLMGRTAGIKLDRLVGMVRLIEEATGRPLPGHKAISGQNLTSPSEYAKVGADQNPLTSQAFHPSMVGHVL